MINFIYFDIKEKVMKSLEKKFDINLYLYQNLNEVLNIKIILKY